MKYPKILIIGQYFNLNTGGGITMTNLFKGWDKQNVAVAAESIYNPNFVLCNKYYQLGSLETKRRFPFNLNRWKKQSKSGVICDSDEPTPFPYTNNVDVSGKQKMYYRLLHFTGLYHYKRRYKISNEFLSWIKEYSPDVIYSQLSAVELIDFVSELNKTLALPIAIHIMDDWPATISNKGLFQSYWRRTIDKRFRSILSNSKVLLSISEAMSKEYLTRYGHHFIPFHNPIDVKFWESRSKTNYDLNGNFVILYAGRIGVGILTCFYDIVQALRSLIIKGLNIELHIHSINFDPLLEDLMKFDFVKVKPAVTHSELPGIFLNADLLLLANDFDNNSISFLKYSMPTKASEYMISGSPILLYSSIENAVTIHALKYHWAYVVSEKNIEKLEGAILELYESKELRSKLAKAAREYATNNYDDIKIRKQFKNCFILESEHNLDN